MTTTYARYEDWLASVGNPDHHVVVGPDWWGCLCGFAASKEAPLHAGPVQAAPTMHTRLRWADVADLDPMSERLRLLWERGELA